NQVSSFGEGDFLVVFCPVVSRVGTDINVAMKGIPGGKPTILVVMHHTFDPERVVAPSRRQVDDPNVRLTVDCLFHEDRLLTCDLNREAWAEVQKLLGSSRPVVTTLFTDLIRSGLHTFNGVQLMLPVKMVVAMAIWMCCSW
uniref:Uncharacterized protein n=1 Tax=Cyclopterus lumpus TaxID=8103 RepID=A0A8C2ZPR6_CYCLU